MIADVTPRRQNHEGTLPKKVPGRDLYRVRVMLDGKRHDVYRRTSTEAAAAARSIVRDHEAGLKPLDPRYTVGDWLKDWLKLYTTNLAPRTVQSYTDTVDLYIEPAIGKVRLAKLHQDDIKRMLANLKRVRVPKPPKTGPTPPPMPLSPTTRRYVYSVLRIALSEAMRQERVHRNVAALVEPPVKAATVVAPLAGETVDALMIALAEHRHRALIVTALTAGLREGELLGLTWKAVDLDRGTVHVHWQLDRLSRLLVEPKRESRRSVDIPPQTVDALKEHRARQRLQRVGKKDWDPRDFVFTTAEGRPHTAGMARRVLRALLADADLPLATTHSLRHTFVTMHLEAGTDLAVVSKLVGHRSISTTSDMYGHLTDGMRKAAADTMGNRLRRKAT